jgi:hypothetical protein
MAMPRADERARVAVVAVVAIIVYAWIAAGLRPFTEPENVLVALPMIPVLILAARRGRGAPDAAPGRSGRGIARQGGLVWLAWLLAVAGWELIALFSSPRDDHPTLSSIADRIMSTHPGRTTIFVVWLALGAALAPRPSRVPDR